MTERNDSRVEAGNNGKKWRPWLLLALVSLFGCFLSLYLPCRIMQSDFAGYESIREFLAFFAFFFFASGFPAVAHTRLRRLLPIRSVAFPASLAGTLLAAYCLVPSFVPELANAEFGATEYAILLLSIFLSPILSMELSAFRAGYLFSEKTGDWLHSFRLSGYATNGNGEPLDPDSITFDEVLRLNPAKKLWNDAYALFMFQDVIPDGEHYLVLVYRERQFTLRRRKPHPQNFLLPLDSGQVAEIQKRFGTFKRTLFINSVSGFARKYRRVTK